MKRHFVLLALGAVFVGSLLSTGCYKYNDDVYLDELDITLTYYDSDFDFQAYNTFSIRDSVGIITNYLKDDEIEDFYKPGGASESIREYIKQKFTSIGYTYVDSDQQPDFDVNLVTAFIDNTYIVSSPGWWWGYYPYYSYYYSWWYPWYGYSWYYNVYSYKSGTLLMEIADGASLEEYRAWADGKTPEEIENARPEEVPDVIINWQALVNGTAGTSADYNKDRAERGVREAFDQSPYLVKN
jgi:hypothetical protein